MGAIIGAQVAMGLSPDELLEINGRWSRRLLAEPAVPRVSLARGERAARMIRSFFDGRRFDDLDLEFFCTTADLTTYAKALYVGGTGNVRVLTVGAEDGDAVTFANHPGGWLPVQVRRVLATGTTATQIVAAFD